MRIQFKTNGGPQAVEIKDETIIDFIKGARNCKNQYGETPNHPIDYCQIAYQLYLEDCITEEEYNNIYNGMLHIMENFK